MNRRWYLYADSTGRVVHKTSTDLDIVPEHDRHNFYEVDADADPSMHYVKDGQLLKKPPKPSQFHEFDIPSETWVPQDDIAWLWVRAERDRRLVKSDWTTLPDVPLTIEQKQEWMIYRQALRDVTQQPDPTNIVWPVAPF